MRGLPFALLFLFACSDSDPKLIPGDSGSDRLDDASSTADAPVSPPRTDSAVPRDAQLVDTGIPVAAVDSSTPTPTAHWDDLAWVPLAWPAAECNARTVKDLSTLPVIPWEPCGDLGCTVLRRQLSPELNLRAGAGGLVQLESQAGNTTTSAIYDENLKPVFVVRVDSPCLPNAAASPRRACLAISHTSGSTAACGDLGNPSAVYELGGPASLAVTDSLIAGTNTNRELVVFDTTTTPATKTVVPVPGVAGGVSIVAGGKQVVARYQLYNQAQTQAPGRLYGWSGGTTWTPLVDIAGQDVIGLSSDGTNLLWARGDVRPPGNSDPYTNLTWWVAPFATKPAQLMPTKHTEYKVNIEEKFPLVVGPYAAEASFDEACLFELASGKRWTLPVPTGFTYWEWSPSMLSDHYVAFQVYMGDPQVLPKAVVRYDLAEVVKRAPDVR
jgi:hypothetical protein